MCAQEAWSQLGLDRVFVVPVGSAPHRKLEGDPGAEVRFELCSRAVDGDERLEVSRAEVDREGPSYTSDTLRMLSGEDQQLTLILGADQACALGEWHEPDEVLSLARLAVASRGGVERSEVLRRLEGLSSADGAAAAERLDFFDMPRIDVSSSLVRSRVASGRPIRYLVGEQVVGEIETNGLYGGRQGWGPDEP
ncbi:MAG: nicotinate-nicotinamide nucleotide adenylyltransferase [Thermoleophilaceae bacterium]|nr:nicotinate-nicotinamide nucleotide adenylyltransferase [Thermoleophilaceae bacterium]